MVVAVVVVQRLVLPPNPNPQRDLHMESFHFSLKVPGKRFRKEQLRKLKVNNMHLTKAELKFTNSYLDFSFSVKRSHKKAVTDQEPH